MVSICESRKKFLLLQLVLALVLLAVTAVLAAPLSDPQVVYGYNALPFTYGNGYYTPLLAYHNYGYPYVNGYGPRAFTYTYSNY